jgi:serine/threonine protein kinase
VYQFKEKLGQGTFGYVYLAEPKGPVVDGENLDVQKLKAID